MVVTRCADTCQLRADCRAAASGVVVTVNGWVIDACEACARRACDPLGSR